MNPRCLRGWLSSLLLVLAFGSVSRAEERPPRLVPGPIFLVEARYPGASPDILAETVAFPIEQQVSGMERVLWLRSRCDSEGKYTLALTFARGANPETTQVLVLNRVNLARPALPEKVRQQGVTVREWSPDVPTIIALRSPGGVHDNLHLSNYATIYVKDELTRLPGMTGATLIGEREYGMRIWLDPDRLAAHNLTAVDVVRLLKEQNLSVSANQGGSDRKEKTMIRLAPSGRLERPDNLSEIVLKAVPKGLIVRLRDVAHIELGRGRPTSRAALDGKPAAILTVHARATVTPRQVRTAVRDRVAELRARLPDGLELSIPFDFTARSKGAPSPYLLLDFDLPEGASPQRRDKLLEHAESLLRQVRGVERTLVLSENPFDLFARGPCILVALAAERQTTAGEVAQLLRARLGEIKEMKLRMREPSTAGDLPRFAYPVDLALYGPERAHVRDFAKKLVERLERSKKLRDMAINPNGSPQRLQTVEIDRTQCTDRGVRIDDVVDTLAVYLGSSYVNDFNRFGRTWQVQIQVGANSKEASRDLLRLQVRNEQGQMVALGDFASLRVREESAGLDRFDHNAMLEISANPAAGVSPEEARKLCSRLAEEVRRELRLPASYRLSWLE